MSDVKSRRTQREAPRSEATPAAATPASAAPEVPSSLPALQPPNPEVPPTVEPAAAAPPPSSTEPAAASADDAWAALVDAQAALSRGFEQAAAELTGMTRTGITAGADAAIALLGARTFAEAVEINTGLARRGVEAMIEGSARLSEIGVNTATEASRPIVSRFGAAWSDLFAA